MKTKYGRYIVKFLFIIVGLFVVYLYLTDSHIFKNQKKDNLLNTAYIEETGTIIKMGDNLYCKTPDGKLYRLVEYK